MSWESPSPLQDTTPDELLSAVLTAVLQDVKLSPVQLGDICVGESDPPGGVLGPPALQPLQGPLLLSPLPSRCSRSSEQVTAISVSAHAPPSTYPHW